MILDFASLITAETETIDSQKSDRLKLDRLGVMYRDYAQHLDRQSQALLDLATKPFIDSQQDTVVDESFSEFLDSWMRSSVSGNFLDEFLTPKERKSYERNNISVRELNESEIEEIVELDLKREVLTIADPENIELWSDCLAGVMEENRSYRFSELVTSVELTPAQIFLALFLSDRFELIELDSSNFYNNFRVVFSSTIKV